MPRLRLPLAGAALGASLLVSAPSAAAGAFAAPDRVVNRETVRVDLTPAGRVKVARLYSQLLVDGHGTVRVADPTSTSGLRDLDGFSVPRTENGNAVWDIDVDGRASRRTLADFPKAALPVDVSVTYELDGRPVDAADVVGRSGMLKATYRVRNVTGAPAEVTYRDGKGATRTATVDVPVPLVGSFRTTLPERFTGVDAPRGDVAGDGRGGTTVAWSLVLFQPLGDPVQEFGWTARMTDGITPRGDVTILPVLPTRKFSVGAYERGANQATELTDGAQQIDANVLKLRDGAGTLLDGLGQLAAGAARLQAGLAGSAEPGAGQLAGGLDQAAAGGATLAGGLGDLTDGAGRLSAGLAAANAGSRALLDGSQDLAAGAGLVSTGAGQVAAGAAAVDGGATAVAGGAADLAAGLQAISAGLAQLSGASGLPAAKAGALALQQGVAAIVAGLGSAATPGTVLNGLAQVAGGLDALGSPTTGLPAAKGGVDAVNAGLATATTSLQALRAAVGGSVAEIQAAMGELGCPGSGHAACALLDSALGSSHGLVTVTQPGLAGVEAGLTSASAGLTQVSGGLATAVSGVSALSAGTAAVTAGVGAVKLGLDNPAGLGVTQGLDALVTGLTAAVAGVTQLNAGAAQAASGATALAAGGATLAAGATALAGGAAQVAGGTDAVAAGAGALSNGALALADGVDQLDAGGRALHAGSAKAAGGSGDLLDGLERLKAGAHRLHAGLGEAADGSGRLAEGLGKAESGGTRLRDGAGRLSKEGTSVLVEKGNETAGEAAKTYATIQALDAKAAAEGLPYGAPAGGTGTAAYVMTLAASDGQAAEDRGRGLAAIALIAVATATGSVLRRRAASP